MKIELIANTTEKVTDNLSEEAKIMAGKAAGICYMPDDYLSNGIQDTEACLKRAKFNAKSGHYSVYDHYHLSLIIECSKAMAMILNSTRLYSTSEKSARYTKMNPKTELEKEKYEKWIKIFTGMFSDKYLVEDDFTDKEVEKMAMENARYMISVFTPTVMEFTIPYSRAILLCQWLDDYSNNIDALIKYDKYYSDNIYHNKPEKAFITELSNECKEFADELRKIIGEDKENPTLINHKDQSITMFQNIYNRYDDPWNDIKYDKDSKDSVALRSFDNMYSSVYRASFAELAQAQRHRTLNYTCYFTVRDDNKFYIPEIIKCTRYVQEWLHDMKELYSKNIITQGRLLLIFESGNISDFILKCKERMCMRAQLEISKITSEQVSKLYKNNSNNDHYSYIKKEVDSLVYYDPLCRCKYAGYTCKEPCKFKTKDIKSRRY